MKIEVVYTKTYITEFDIDDDFTKEILENFRNRSEEKSVIIKHKFGSLLNNEYEVVDWRIDTNNLPIEFIQYKEALERIARLTAEYK